MSLFGMMEGALIGDMMGGPGGALLGAELGAMGVGAGGIVAAEAIALACGCFGSCRCGRGMGMGLGMGMGMGLACGCFGSCRCGYGGGYGGGFGGGFGGYGGGYGARPVVIQNTYVQPQPMGFVQQQPTPMYAPRPAPAYAAPAPGYASPAYSSPAYAQPPPSRPLSAFGFYGACADVTMAVRVLAARGPVPVSPASLQVDPAPGQKKGACVVYSVAGVRGQTGAPDGGTLAVPPGALVHIALFGAFSDVTSAVRARASGPVFDVPASGYGDPAPGAAKSLFVLIEGGANSISQIFAAADGVDLRVDVTGRAAPYDRFG